MSNSTSSKIDFSFGENGFEKEICKRCHKVKYVPLYPNAKNKHDYVCPNCGDRIHIVPNVTVE